MANGIDLRGKDEVLAQFEVFDTPYFSVYQGKDLKFYHDQDNLDDARELLSSNLEILERNQSTAPFKIVYYTQLNNSGKLTADNCKGSGTFRVMSPGVSYNNPNFGNPEIISGYPARGAHLELLKKQQEEIQELKEKLDLIIESQTEDNEPQDAMGGFNGVIGALLNNPAIQNVIVGKLISLVDKILPEQKEVPAARVAGITDESEVQGALRDLFAAGMTIADLQKLADMSKTNAALFQILLGQLRNQ